MYIVANAIKMPRKEFENFLVRYIKEEKAYNLRNLLPSASLEKNVRHHPFRIALELGIPVTRGRN